MKRRISSRDDLFLSVVDMFTLLSMLFIGVAFMTTSGGDIRVLDLPVASTLSTSPPATPRPSLEIEWTHPDAVAVVPAGGERCYVTVSGMFPELSPLNAPCWPRGFTGINDETPDPGWERLRTESVNRNSPVSVICHQNGREPARDLLLCARLQWVAAQSNLHTVALVR